MSDMRSSARPAPTLVCLLFSPRCSPDHIPGRLRNPRCRAWFPGRFKSYKNDSAILLGQPQGTERTHLFIARFGIGTIRARPQPGGFASRRDPIEAVAMGAIPADEHKDLQ